MDCTALLNMATTFIEDTRDSRKVAAQESVLQSYRRLRKPGGVQVFLFTTRKSAWIQKALAFHVIVVNDTAVNPHGTPKVSMHSSKHSLCRALTTCYAQVASMLEKIQAINTRACGHAQPVVFDGYANGDIVFTQVLARAHDLGFELG